MCTSPVTIRYSNSLTGATGFKSILVPCGKCMDCRRRYQNDWAFRISEELKSYGYKGVFVTLTYNNDSVPRIVDESTGEVYLSVCKKHVQDAIKRFRTSLSRSGYGSDFSLRYYLTSEYGPRTLRPHYHAIFFGLDKEELLPFIEDWESRFGFVSASDISGKPSSVARYVAKYCSKGVFENPFVAKGKVFPTFHLISKGLGASFLDDPSVLRHYRDWPFRDKYVKVCDKVDYSDSFVEFVATRLKVSFDGYDLPMPRYYKIKLYGSKNTLSLKVEDFLFRRNEQVLDEKCKQIQSFRNCSYAEALNTVVSEDILKNQCREEKLIKDYERFYDKSKL